MIDQYIQQYGRRLYGLCRSLCADPFDADDLYQETWLRAVQYLPQYDPGREFEPWLTRICVNTYRSTLRRLAKSPLLGFSNTEEKDRLLETYGRLACTREDLAAVDKHDLVAVRRSQYTTEGLVRDRAAFACKYPSLTVEPVSLDEIMVFMEKGERL